MSKVENRENYLLLPNSNNHNCFGCSPRNYSGLQMKFYTNEKMDSVVSWLTISDQFCGWGNLVHGGIISTILDEVMGWASLLILRRFILTKSIAVDFIKPVLLGKEIRAEGSLLKVNSEREAVIEGSIYNDDGDICARSSSVVSLFTMETVKKMGVADEDLLSELEQIMNNIDFEQIKNNKLLLS